MDTHADWPPLTRAIGLYVLTLALEVPVMVLRTFVVWTIAALLLFIGGHSVTGADQWALLGFCPTVWSICALLPQWDDSQQSRVLLAGALTLIVAAVLAHDITFALLCALVPLGVLISPWATGWWWCTRLGGRQPTTDERTAYEEAMLRIDDETIGELLPYPYDWFVLDLPEPEAAVCGWTLMLTRPMLDSPFLAAALAHERAHLVFDARMTAAVNRLVIHLMREPHPDQEHYKQQSEMILTPDPVTQTIVAAGMLALATRKILRWCRGGLGLWLLRPLWGTEWRLAEYEADAGAARAGQAAALAQALRVVALIYDRPVPFKWMSAEAHPPTALRIDRLEHPDDTQAPTFAEPQVNDFAAARD
jgi:Zn-dependent protease with chaperone function